MKEVRQGFVLAPKSFLTVYSKSDGFLETYGSVTALPSVTEKGHVNVRLTVSSPGGHSSIPPDHTVKFFLSSSAPAVLISHRVSVSWQR